MRWQDHPDNPLIGPRWWSPIVGDPTVLLPDLTPDGRWRMWANQATGIDQYRSDDGVAWRPERRVSTTGNRPWILAHDGVFHLWYQAWRGAFRRSLLVVRTSRDLATWSPPVPVLEPTLPWEGRHVSNACVIPWEGGFRLYYSASSVHLPDMGFGEPRYVSVAWGPSPLGPFRKHGEPLLGDEPGHPFRARGAGALKVVPGLLPGGRLAGFQNGIHRGPDGRSASSLLLLRSTDGLTWEDHPANPLIAPDPAGPSWKRAHVYQCDVRRVGDALWLWYNARDGWRFGRERIGLAILPDASALAEGWEAP